MTEHVRAMWLTSVSVLLLAAFTLALLVVLRPSMRPDKAVILAVLALCCAACLGGAALIGGSHWLQLPLGIATLALIPAVAIARGFGSVDMIAFLFHRDFGMQGASLRSLKNEIAAAVIAALVMCAAALGIQGLWGFDGLILSGATGIALLCNPFVRFAVRRLWSRPVVSVLPDRLARPALLPPQGRDPDLLIVYLEGTDRRFADPGAYGQAYAPLAEFAAEGISLTRVGQIAGTGWSLAGMVASQAGVPILPRGVLSPHKAERVARFMPGITFLGDVLAARGYASHYVVGGETGFGGIGAMYSAHQIGGMTGFAELCALFPAAEVEAARVSWYLDDQMVLDGARRVHRDLASGDRPFALIVETIGPHGPKGCLSRRWTDTGKARETRDIARVVHCMLREVMEFVAEIRAAQPSRGRGLRIVLLSDHLNHIPTLPASRPDLAGCNTAILWGAPDRRGEVVDRPGSMVDIFPTLLDWLGWAKSPVAAGLGRSLLSSEPTLVEEFGIARLDAMIAGDARLSRLVWGETPVLAEPSATA